MDIKKEQPETDIGTVVETLPDAIFRVEFGDGSIRLAYLCGKMRQNRIKVILGDKVLVQLDKYGGKGRIVKRI